VGAILTAVVLLALARARLDTATAAIRDELAGARAELAAERRLREKAASLEERHGDSFARLPAEALDRQATQARVAVESAVAPLAALARRGRRVATPARGAAGVGLRRAGREAPPDPLAPA
jgi:hypothetical protein